MDIRHEGSLIMRPLFTAVETFGPSDGDAWRKYVEWSGLTQLSELVSLDQSLCQPAIKEVIDGDWAHIVDCESYRWLFDKPDYLKGRLDRHARLNLLCVYKNPADGIDLSEVPTSFRPVGFDFIEARTGISAITNCGGFTDVFTNSELSEHGLITNLERAIEIQSELRRLHPDENHADCDLWAIFRSEV
jgi:hypothetical protein